MKSLIFKIKWLIKFRARFLFTRKKDKSIALVVNSFNKGGLEQVVLSLYYGYKKMGYRVYILCAFNDAPLAKNLHDLRDIYIFNNNPEKFIQFCFDKHINVLHYHYNTLMIRAARQMGFKVIYTMHNVYTWFTKEELQAYKNRLDSAHYVACVSSYVKDYYTSLTGATNAVAIPNGIDFTKLEKTNEDFVNTREKLGIEKDQKTIGMVASFYPVKHQIGMIGVMEQLIKTNKEAVLLCVGGVGSKDYYDKFNEILEGSTAKNHIKHIEHMENRHIGQFLKESVDIFSLPTLQEGFGNATIEGMYAKKPVVITDTGAARDVKKYPSVIVTKNAYSTITEIKSGQMDTLALQKDNINTQEIALAIKTILDNFDEYKKLADEAASHLKDFTIDEMIKKYVQLLG